jgi:hypothetical protein
MKSALEISIGVCHELESFCLITVGFRHVEQGKSGYMGVAAVSASAAVPAAALTAMHGTMKSEAAEPGQHAAALRRRCSSLMGMRWEWLKDLLPYWI